MFIITQDQEYILGILKKTRFMRTNQAVRLIASIDAEKIEPYALRILNQLQHMQKITWKTESVFTLPFLYNEAVDENMLSAIDIALDLIDYKIVDLSTKNKPCKLCFLTGQADKLKDYAVIIVPDGFEAEITEALCGEEYKKRTIIFLLAGLWQKDNINISLPHFFAIKDNGRYRYFEGGD